MSSKRIKVTMTLLVFIFIICISILKPQDDPSNIFKCITISTATIIATIIYFNFLWKIKPFNSLHPDILLLDGKWAATMTMKDETTAILDVKIKQTFDTISINIKSSTFNAKSIAATFIKDPDKLILYFIYQTKDNKNKSSIHTPHIGTMKLICSENELKGFYYNDLKESNEITFVRLDNKEDIND